MKKNILCFIVVILLVAGIKASPSEEEDTVCLLNYCTTMQGFRFSDQKRTFPFEEPYDFDVWGYPDRLSLRPGTAEIFDAGELDYDSLNEVPEGEPSGTVKVYKDHVYIIKCADGKYVKMQILDIEPPPREEELEEGEEFFPHIVFRWDYFE